VIDTTQVATDTIDYVATDPNGLTATSTRTVIIETAAPLSPPPPGPGLAATAGADEQRKARAVAALPRERQAPPNRYPLDSGLSPGVQMTTLRRQLTLNKIMEGSMGIASSESNSASTGTRYGTSLKVEPCPEK
jgi:hypothetical protein